MDSRISDLIRYLVLGAVVLAVSIFAHKHYAAYASKKEVVAELQSLTSDASFYRQFDADGAHTTLLRAVYLIEWSNQLGQPPSELMDRIFGRGGIGEYGSDPSGDFPTKESLVRNTLINAHDAAKRLGMLHPSYLRELKDGHMPVLDRGIPVIVPLISPEVSPGMEKIIPNLEIRPPDHGVKGRALTPVETAAALRLAKDLAQADLIERHIATAIAEHYRTPLKRETSDDAESPQ